MTRPARILRNAAVIVAGLILVVGTGAIWIVQTDWFRQYVTRKVVTATEESIGGRVEVGSMRFDWRHLEVNIDGYVIHGNEPAEAAPFVRVPHVRVDLRLFTSFKRFLNISFLGLDQPEVNLLVNADGSTNVPAAPHPQAANNSSPLETLVDIAIGQFELKDGTIHYNSRAQALDVQGNNLRVQLAYHILKQDYEGSVAFQPLYVAAGRNTPVSVSLDIPVTLTRDRIAVQDATVTTALSQLKLSGAVENLSQPRTSAQLTGHLSLVDLNNLGNLSLAVDPKSNLSTLELEANVDVGQNTIAVKKLHATLGNSTVDASGSTAAADFTSTLNLAELSRLLKDQHGVNGSVAFDGQAAYAGDVLRLNRFRLRGFGGQIQGTASLEQFARYRVDAQLSGIDLQGLQQRLGMKPLPYSGSAEGRLEAHGDIRSSSPDDSAATAKLKIVPGRTGIPVSGNIDVAYDSAAADLRSNDSTLRFPQTSVNVKGSVRQGLQLALVSRDLHDLFAAVPGSSASQTVKLKGGQANLQAAVSGSLRDPIFKGHLTATRIVVQDRQFDEISADFDAGKSHVAVSSGSISRGTMQARFAGSVGLHNWESVPSDPLSITANVMNGDLADVLALSGQPSSGMSGALTASIDIAGTVGNPTGSANVQVLNGAVNGEPFDQIQAQVALTDGRVSLPGAFLRRESTRLNVSAEYTHSRDSFATGNLTAHVNGGPVELAQIRNWQTRYPNSAGTIQLDATVAGATSEDHGENKFQLTSLAGDFSVTKVRLDGRDYGDLTAKASTSGNTVTYNLASNVAGGQVRADGRTQLTADYPTNLDATLNNLPIERVLALARQTDIPAKGIAAGTIHLSGTAKDPQAQVDLTLSNGALYDEPVDRLQVRGHYLAKSIEITQLQAAAGPSRLGLSARFDHPAGDLNQGNLEFQVENSRIDLSRIRNVQLRRPGLGGTLQVSGTGKASLNPGTRVVLEDLKAQLSATGLSAQGKSLGNLNLAGNTSGGRLNFTLDSTLANGSFQGHGDTQLSGNYSTNAELTFKDLTWANLRPLAGSTADSFDGTTSGSITVNGPIAQLDQLSASVRLTTLQLRPMEARRASGQPVILQNQGDVAFKLDRGQLRIESAHLTGPQTDITASGGLSAHDKTVDLKIDATANLALLKEFSPDTFSSGTVVVATTVQGALSNPRVNGRLELRAAAASYPGLPLGLSNANGVIAFNGNTATIQNLTADSGGGKITITGFVSRENPVRFALRASGKGVRVRVDQGVSAVTTANLSLTGTLDSSLVSGTVALDRLTYLPQTDIGSMLTRTAPPVQSTNSPSFLTNMKLDIAVRTSSSTFVQTSGVQNLHVITDLRIRGSAAQPGAVGSVQMSQGKLAFFGSVYTIDTGTISFYNQNRIAPILNLSLGTLAQGVKVTLSVTGPVDNMKLSYTSDPPLQFEEIVALLAAGQTPTSDPTLLANQSSQPPQSFEERGESALLSKALADPVSSRLQRVFGVSQLKIDPSFSSGSQLPQARVTLQQQVAQNVVFTYVTALDNPNTQEIRIEWSLNPQWSAIANRDENGLFSINLQYKKEFR